MEDINKETLIEYIKRLESDLKDTLVIDKKIFNEEKLDELIVLLNNH